MAESPTSPFPGAGGLLTLLETHSLATRMENLESGQKRILAWAADALLADRPHLERESAMRFLLPFAEFGLSFRQIRELASRLPADWPADHAEVYFDFRLQRWMRILEPPTLAELLDEIVATAPTPIEGMAAVEAELRAFLERQPGGED